MWMPLQHVHGSGLGQSLLHNSALLYIEIDCLLVNWSCRGGVYVVSKLPSELAPDNHNCWPIAVDFVVYN